MAEPPSEFDFRVYEFVKEDFGNTQVVLRHLTQGEFDSITYDVIDIPSEYVIEMFDNLEEAVAYAKRRSETLKNRVSYEPLDVPGATYSDELTGPDLTPLSSAVERIPTSSHGYFKPGFDTPQTEFRVPVYYNSQVLTEILEESLLMLQEYLISCEFWVRRSSTDIDTSIIACASEVISRRIEVEPLLQSIRDFVSSYTRTPTTRELSEMVNSFEKLPESE